MAQLTRKQLLAELDGIDNELLGGGLSDKRGEELWRTRHNIELQLGEGIPVGTGLPE